MKLPRWLRKQRTAYATHRTVSSLRELLESRDEELESLRKDLADKEELLEKERVKARILQVEVDGLTEVIARDRARVQAEIEMAGGRSES